MAALALTITNMGCVNPAEYNDKNVHLTNNVTDWRDEIIYQVLIDRFYDGDYSNNYNVNLNNQAGYHGGDWQGLEDKLDYIAELGATTLWISPVVKNVEEDAGFASYHGYWTPDFEKTNPHFGDYSALRKLVDAAHAKGFKVVLDIVVNHVGQAFYYDINKNGQPDEYYIGQGGQISAVGQNDPASDLIRVQEWDPDFNIDGIQAWTSLGPSGEAPAIFVHNPGINRMPPQPEVFSNDWAYNRKGRVTVWTKPEICGCESWGCPWDNQCLRQQETLGDFPGGLKDINTQNPIVREEMIRIFSRWIDIADFDGFRIDTLKHVEPDFFSNDENGFCPRIREHALNYNKKNFFMFGEAFDGNDNLLGSYTQGNGVDSVFYFSQYYTVFRGAMLGNGDSTCEIARLNCRRKGCSVDPCGGDQTFTALYNNVGKPNGPTDENGKLLNAQQLVVNFIENHDVGRLAFFMDPSWKEDTKMKVIKQALAYLMYAEGIPCLYYGVEQGFAGGNDPANRETMWLEKNYTKQVLKDGHYQDEPKSYDSDGDGVNDTIWQPFDTGNPYFTWIKQLTSLRKQHLSLSRGELNSIYTTRDGSDNPDHGIYAFERLYANDYAAVVFNFDLNQESQTSNGTQSMAVSIAPGTMLYDAFDPKYTVPVENSGCTAGAGQGCVNVSVPARGVRLLLAN